jgi:hypothetical protein
MLWGACRWPKRPTGSASQNCRRALSAANNDPPISAFKLRPVIASLSYLLSGTILERKRAQKREEKTSEPLFLSFSHWPFLLLPIDSFLFPHRQETVRPIPGYARAKCLRITGPVPSRREGRGTGRGSKPQQIVP